jgi:hypothetical protein
VVEETPSALVVGAHDPHSGLAALTVNGASVLAGLSSERVWNGPPANGPVTVIATDRHGNETRYQRRQPR